MIGEILAKTAIEADKELTNKTVKEIGKVKTSVDIGKRIDIKKNVLPNDAGKIDISKRVPKSVSKEISEKNISREIHNYLKDLKNKSTCSETIPKKAFDLAKMELRSTEQIAELRDEFDADKGKIRKEWARLNNREWPTYDTDIFNDNGKKLRKAGDCYDAHHIMPLKLGGSNDISNITPLHLNDHNEIHKKIGSCTKVIEQVEGARNI